MKEEELLAEIDAMAEGFAAENLCMIRCGKPRECCQSCKLEKCRESLPWSPEELRAFLDNYLLSGILESLRNK